VDSVDESDAMGPILMSDPNGRAQFSEELLVAAWTWLNYDRSLHRTQVLELLLTEVEEGLRELRYRHRLNPAVEYDGNIKRCAEWTLIYPGRRKKHCNDSHPN
jgi:hypothetical protein